MSCQQLEAGHSTECITDAGHSIALNTPALLCHRRPCGKVTLRDDMHNRNETVPHGCLVATDVMHCDSVTLTFDLLT